MIFCHMRMVVAAMTVHMQACILAAQQQSRQKSAHEDNSHHEHCRACDRLMPP